ncbi:DUF3502 domain-containing protein, partial [Oscillospiraceae bacterium OttesenSCG-928-F05]|nr:DUF3502 domain-containing protein [Oscillospiraceae bacterium OttesenSCG-928-F05]
ILDAHENTQLSLIPETPEYMVAVMKAREWNEKGYTLADTATDATTGQELMKAGRLFTITNSMKAGEAGQTYTATQQEVIDVFTVEPFANTHTAIAFVWTFPEFSQSPTEYAIKWMNSLYGNEELVNLMCYGFEGEHYVVLDDGHLDYPDGVTGETSGWSLQMNWMMGDQFKAMVWKGTDFTVWDEQDDMNKNATRSLSMGIMFNTENVKTEMSAVLNVIAEYRIAIECGMVDPQAMVPEYVAKMKAAGADVIMAEKQRQIDEAHGA